MRHLLCPILLCCSFAGPLSAQEPEEEDGGALMERGAQQFLEGLLQEMEPAWREMQGFMEQMGPALLGLMDEIKDWSVYEPPEILDNGDVIIRRKPQIPEDAPPAPEPLPQIEL